MVIRVMTKDRTKHKVLLILNTKKREALEEEIPKVFDLDHTSDQYYGKLFQTLDQLGDKQLKPY